MDVSPPSASELMIIAASRALRGNRTEELAAALNQSVTMLEDSVVNRLTGAAETIDERGQAVSSFVACAAGTVFTGTSSAGVMSSVALPATVPTLPSSMS